MAWHPRSSAWLLALAACGSHAATPASPPLSNAPPDAGAGAAAAPAEMQCTAGGERAEFNPYGQARSVEGDDGAHLDACDAQGDLVSYQCENESYACASSGRRDRRPALPCYRQTGRVEVEHVDCDGRCAAGACAERCPQFGDTLTYLRVDGNGGAVFDSDGDARHIECTVGFDQQDSYDCTHDPRPGDQLVVEGLGLSTTTCTGGVWGALSDRRCTYTGCRYVR